MGYPSVTVRVEVNEEDVGDGGETVVLSVRENSSSFMDDFFQQVILFEVSYTTHPTFILIRLNGKPYLGHPVIWQSCCCLCLLLSACLHCVIE